MIHLLVLIAAAATGAFAAQESLPDSESIANDISKYKKLYLSYENCAWSSYGEEGQDNPCNVAEGDEDYWYLGLTACLRANAAYSLYGVLNGEEDEGCTKGTFINSFFTTSGVENFVESLANAGVEFSDQDQDAEINLSSECQAVDNGGDGEDENGDDGAQNDGAQVDYTANNRKIYEDTTSIGLGCSKDENTFVFKTYSGSYCDERGESQVTDTLSNFNKEIEKAKCIVVYEAAQNNGDDDGAQQEQNLDFLEDSVPCNTRLYPHQCPDPFKIIKNNHRAIVREATRDAHPVRETVKLVFSWILVCFGGILMAASAVAFYNKSKARRQQTDEQEIQQKSSNGGWRRKFGKKSASSKHSTNSTNRGFRRLFSRGSS